MSNLQEKIMQDALGIKNEDRVCSITQQRIGGLFEDIGNELATKETPAGAQAKAKEYTDLVVSSYVSKRDAMRLFPDTVQSPLVDGFPVENKIVYCSGSGNINGVHAMFGTGSLGFSIQANNRDILKNKFSIAKTFLNESGVDSGKYTWTDSFELFHTGNFNPSEYVPKTELSNNYMEVLCAGTKKTDTSTSFNKVRGCTIAPNSQGVFKVQHNYGSTDYIVFTNCPSGIEREAYVIEKTANYFTLQICDNADGVCANRAVDFIAYKI